MRWEGVAAMEGRGGKRTIGKREERVKSLHGHTKWIIRGKVKPDEA